MTIINFVFSVSLYSYLNFANLKGFKYFVLCIFRYPETLWTHNDEGPVQVSS